MSDNYLIVLGPDFYRFLNKPYILAGEGRGTIALTAASFLQYVAVQCSAVQLLAISYHSY